MTFPQPSSTQALLQTQGFFRLKTQLQSPGDIFESEVGSHAICLGPDSDLATVNLFYFDPLDRYFIPVGGLIPQADPSKMSSLTISPTRPFVGLLTAVDEDYPGINRPGRILIAAADIVDPNYLPSGYNPAQDALSYEPIYIDVIQYFQPPPTPFPARTDKTYRYMYFPPVLAAGGSSFVVLPAYGRKSGFFTFKNLTANIVTVHIYGVRLSTSNTPGPIGAMETQLFTAAVAATTGSDVYTYNASTDGDWDYLYFELENYTTPGSSAFPVTVQLSDQAL